MMNAAQLTALQTTRQLRCDNAGVAERNCRLRLDDLLAGQTSLLRQQQLFDQQTVSLGHAVNARVIAGVSPVEAIEWLQSERSIQRADLARQAARFDASVREARSQLASARQARKAAEVQLEKVRSLGFEVAGENRRREERLESMAQDELNAEHAASSWQFAGRGEREAYV